MKKKKIILIIEIIILVILAICTAKGFQKRTDVVLKDYSVSEDGKKITMTVQISSSAGYTRGYDIKPGLDNKYITFYSTFGFVNSKMGAKDTFEIDVDEMSRKIYFYKGDGGYELVLVRDEETNEWRRTKNYIEENTKLEGFVDIPQEFKLEEAVQKGYFVIDNTNGKDRIYNRKVLDSFIENTKIDANNRKADKIRIAHYNFDGYPTIYEVEYKIFDEKYKNEKGQEVNKSGYILKTDASRNNVIPKSLTTEDDLPGEIYGIVIEETEVESYAIKLKSFMQANTETNEKLYEDIEVTRYVTSAETIN